MAIRDPEAKRLQLLAAGLAEFAQYGLAGGRVDRIAAAAKCSAGLVYTYFGSKEDLFDAVFETVVVRTVTEIPIDVDNLPAYAVRLFEGALDHPDVARLITWYRLERGDRPPLQLSLTSMREKAAEIAAAQEAGKLSSFFSPEDLLTLVLHQGELWAAIAPDLEVVDGTAERARMRDLVAKSVEAILAR
jgi:AcrR family transcriptional regulator